MNQADSPASTPQGASEDNLNLRPFTKLYNAGHKWLDNGRRSLDKAVFAVCGWPATWSDQETLAFLLALNRERAAAHSGSA